MGAINTISIVKKAKDALNKGSTRTKIRARLKANGEKAAIKMAAQLQAVFAQHPVTRELFRGASARSSVSDWPGRSGVGKYGNLSAFFGLDSEKVTGDLAAISALLNSPTVVVEKSGDFGYRVILRFPILEQYYKITPSPSPRGYGISWLKGMEEGLIKNFSHFLFNRKGVKSRTGTGVQVKGEIDDNATSMPKIPYIKDIYQTVFVSNREKAISIFKESVKRL